MYIDKVLFPVTPGKMSVKINNQNKTITLINEGEVNLIKAPGLTDITIDELILPAFQKYPFAMYDNNKFKKGNYYLNKLETWKKKKNPVTFIISRVTPDGRTLLWDTNLDVTIEDYEIIEDADDQGFDVKVKLTLKQYRYWGAKKLKKKGNKVTLTQKIRKTKNKAKSYTIKKSDKTLMQIAKKQLNSSSKWKQIYTLNKKTIEKAAKKHGRKSSSNGRYIYSGTKLKLPS